MVCFVVVLVVYAFFRTGQSHGFSIPINDRFAQDGLCDLQGPPRATGEALRRVLRQGILGRRATVELCLTFCLRFVSRSMAFHLLFGHGVRYQAFVVLRASVHSAFSHHREGRSIRANQEWYRVNNGQARFVNACQLAPRFLVVYIRRDCDVVFAKGRVDYVQFLRVDGAFRVRYLAKAMRKAINRWHRAFHHFVLVVMVAMTSTMGASFQRNYVRTFQDFRVSMFKFPKRRRFSFFSHHGLLRRFFIVAVRCCLYIKCEVPNLDIRNHRFVLLPQRATHRRFRTNRIGLAFAVPLNAGVEGGARSMDSRFQKLRDRRHILHPVVFQAGGQVVLFLRRLLHFVGGTCHGAIRVLVQDSRFGFFTKGDLTSRVSVRMEE